jgi:cytochrome c553
LRKRWGWWAILLTTLFVDSSFAQSQCGACHGADGNSLTPRIPSIAGQPKLFIENQLVLIREGLRPSPEMFPFVKDLKDAQIVALAKHFSALPARPTQSSPEDPALLKRGAELGRKLRCRGCHLPDYGGQNQIPRLAAQREDWLEPVMREFRDKPRPGGDTIMAAALYGVSDADIKALAHFLSRSGAPAPGR